ncbi:19378_t:CDS:2, partial [Gigaspora margarita]
NRKESYIKINFMILSTWASNINLLVYPKASGSNLVTSGSSLFLFMWIDSSASSTVK